MNSDAASSTNVTGTRLCAIEDVADGGVFECSARVDGEAESLLVLRAGAAARVFFNVCPHAGRRLDWAPGRFMLDDGYLICAAHAAMFSIPDGTCIAGPCRGESLREVPSTLQHGEVWIA